MGNILCDVLKDPNAEKSGPAANTRARRSRNSAETDEYAFMSRHEFPLEEDLSE
jgi:hypothetical protein